MTSAGNNAGIGPIPEARTNFVRYRLPFRAGGPVLAVGSDGKSSLCVIDGEHADLYSPGQDLSDPEARREFKKLAERAAAALPSPPVLVAHDLHPDMASTRMAPGLGARTYPVQHHHAHMAQVLASAKDGVEGPAIGIIFDGMGLGPGGLLMGGEFLLGDLIASERIAGLLPVPQPGGDAAALEPWRMALAYLKLSLPGDWADALPCFAERIGSRKIAAVSAMIEKGVNCPATTSAGRLFDAVSSLLGIHDYNTTPALAAIGLEQEAAALDAEPLPFGVHESQDAITLDPRPAIGAIAEGLGAGAPRPELAAGFHLGLAMAAVRVCALIRERSGVGRALISGGVFQNNLLREHCNRLLESEGFEIVAGKAPVHDGALALGQASAAAAALAGTKRSRK